MFDDFGYELFAIVGMFVDVIEDGPAFAVLSDYVVEVVVVIEFIDFDDVRVVKFWQQLHFGKELFLDLFGHLLLFEHLDGSLLFGGFADGAIDISKGPFADFFLKLIVLCYRLFWDSDEILYVYLDLLKPFLTVEISIQTLSNARIIEKIVKELLLILFVHILLLFLCMFTLFLLYQFLQCYKLFEEVQAVVLWIWFYLIWLLH